MVLANIYDWWSKEWILNIPMAIADKAFSSLKISMYSVFSLSLYSGAWNQSYDKIFLSYLNGHKFSVSDHDKIRLSIAECINLHFTES